MTVTDTVLEAPPKAAMQPWPGLAAFTEALQDFFFGRAAETEELFRRVRGETVTLLYGQSGLGKTSLLRAGLARRLREAAFLPVFVRLDYAEGAQSPLAQVKGEFERAAAAVQAETTRVEGEDTLWGYFHRTDRMVTSRLGELLVPVLIFDQFEEVFTLGLACEANRATAHRFLTELAELIENRPPDSVEKAIESDAEALERYQFDRQEYRIVIALREDYLPQLDSMRERAPLIVRNRFRLRRMTGRQGFDAVTRPVPGLIAPELAWEITRIAARENPEDAVGPAPGEGADGLEVEPFLLSLVCRELNERRIELGLHRVTPDLLADKRASILESFCEKALADQHPAVRKFVEDALLSETGVRESVSLDRALLALAAADVPADALDTLVGKRLLRIEERHRISRVEIIHDALAPVIRTSREIRHGREEEAEANRRKAEAERQSREKEDAARREADLLRERRRKWWAYAMAGALALMTAIAIVLGSVAVKQWMEAERRGSTLEALARANEYLAGMALTKEGDKGTTRYKEAMHWFRIAANDGNAAAQFSIGFMYENGLGADLDYNEAMRWYREAATRGNIAAFMNIGDMYIRGEGRKQDYPEGLGWYQKAAERGYSPAYYAIGYYHENGQGVPQDDAEALSWYQKAAELDNASAKDKVGYFYENGKSVKQDYVSALHWYQEAAKQNNSRSKYHIGIFYALGRAGLPNDMGQAHAWIEEARAGNVVDAFQWLVRNPLDAGDGASYLAAENERLGAAQDLDSKDRSEESKEAVAFARIELSWALMLNNRLPDAIAQIDEARTLEPTWPEIEVKRAHASLLQGQVDEAKQLYLKHKDKTWGFGRKFSDVIRDDFAEMRSFRIDTAEMKKIEELLPN
jgi:TPR repeat protein